MTDKTLDDEDAQEIQEDLAASDEDVSFWQRLSAGAQLALLFTALGGGIVAGVITGIIDPYIEIIATINIGWIIEYLVGGIAALFLLYVFSLILIWLPGSIISGLAGLAYGIAKQQGLISDE